jgi:DDE superfamily endonuclease
MSPASASPASASPASVAAPFSRFSATLLAALLVQLGVVASLSPRTVGRWIKEERLKPWRFRSWITPKDLGTFLQRACPVLDLYQRVRNNLLEAGEVVFSADEKTSIQARHHATYRSRRHGEPAHLEHTDKRGGAVNLLAALNVATGLLLGQVFPQKRFAEFSSFLTVLINNAVDNGARRIHLILDNGSLHRPAYLNAWLARQFPDVEVIVHWLPVRSSWLNQIEIYFGILQRQSLTPNDFPNTEAVKERILGHIALRNRNPKPIRWSYTSAQLRAKYEPRLRT